LVSIFIWHVGAAPQKPAPAVSYPQEISRVTLAIAGDVIPHEPVVRSAEAKRMNLTDPGRAKRAITEAGMHCSPMLLPLFVSRFRLCESRNTRRAETFRRLEALSI
jgi:hypothetical protein